MTSYKLWQLMVAVAALAGLFAAFGVVGATGITLAISVVCRPILLARPGRKLRAAAWVFSFYPLLGLGSLYVSWLTAWCGLGHPPHWSPDDPKFISSIVEVLFDSTVAFTMGTPFALFLVGPIVVAHDVQSFRKNGLHPIRMTVGLGTPVLVWLSVFAILWFRLFGVREIFEWCWD
jgi:hypothetical protein